MTRAYYRVMEGDPSSISVQFAVLLSGLAHAKNTKQAGGDSLLADSAFRDLRLDVGAARDLLVSGQNRSHRLLEENFGRLWKVVKDRQKAPVPTSEGWRKWKWIAIGAAAVLAFLAPILSYQHGVSVGERDLAGQVAETLKDSAALGPWITTHKGFLIFEPTLNSDGKSFRSIVVVFPGLRNQDVGLTARGSAFINLPEDTPH